MLFDPQPAFLPKCDMPEELSLKALFLVRLPGLLAGRHTDIDYQNGSNVRLTGKASKV
jgi:hypothetical protein